MSLDSIVLFVRDSVTLDSIVLFVWDFVALDSIDLFVWGSTALDRHIYVTEYCICLTCL